MSKTKDKRFAAAHGRERKTWEVSEPWDLHHNIRRRIFLGQKGTVIAKALGCTPQEVSNVRNSKVVMDELELMHAAADKNVIDVKATIGKLAEKAIEKMEALLDDEKTPHAVIFNVSKDILERSGNQAPPVAQHHVHTVLTSEEIEHLKTKAKQIGMANGTVTKDDEDIIDVDALPLSEPS